MQDNFPMREKTRRDQVEIDFNFAGDWAGGRRKPSGPTTKPSK